MFKLSYVVSRTGHPHYIPLAVSGKNGQSYGHALWDQTAQAHVFRFTKEQWEGTGDKPGAMTEILKRANRGSAIWMVRAEVDLDEESPVGQLSQELDAVRSELEETKRKLEATQQEYKALSEAIHKPTNAEGVQQFAKARAEADFSLNEPKVPASLAGDGIRSESAADMVGPEETMRGHSNGPGSDNRRAMSIAQITMTPEEAEAAGMVVDEPATEEPSTPSQEPPSSKLKGLKFNELQEQARAANEQGAEIPLDTIKTKVGLTAALGDWLDSQPATPEPATTEGAP